MAIIVGNVSLKEATSFLNLILVGIKHKHILQIRVPAVNNIETRKHTLIYFYVTPLMKANFVDKNNLSSHIYAH
jgi:hypothetical protein